jgi:6-pyruvoyltetrahydropterin/6-carboxytetrahydropterin synthase
MYSVSVQHKFIANHFLIGGDWGKENFKHAHTYRLELILSGRELDKHGYLVDIIQIEQVFGAITLRYEDKLLNELPEFNGLNPSVERFAETICRQFNEEISAANIINLRVILWENDIAWASFEMER